MHIGQTSYLNLQRFDANEMACNNRRMKGEYSSRLYATISYF